MRDRARWIGSFVFVLAIHAAAIGVALSWTVPDAPYAPPPAAIMIDLAPLPAAPEAAPNEAPPGPELSEAIPEPEEPPPVKIELAEVSLPEPEPPPPLDLKPPPPKPPEKKVEKKPPQPKVSAPQAAPTQATVAAAPMAGATPEPPSAALPTWKGLLLRHLEKHKRYPSEAQRARKEGVPYVFFTMSRDGRVLASRIVRSSGVASLDQEGLELLQRAQPLPPLPSDQPGETLDLVVPIQFFLKR